MAPAIQLDGLQPKVDEDFGDIYPIDVSGVQAEGRAVYVSQGCVACHTEQVRGRERRGGPGARLGCCGGRWRGIIFTRGRCCWGICGSGRTLRTSGRGRTRTIRTSTPWHGTTCICTTRRRPRRARICRATSSCSRSGRSPGQVDADALKLTGGRRRRRRATRSCRASQARQLVAYLTTLDHSHPLPEAGPNIQPPKPGVSGGAAK